MPIRRVIVLTLLLGCEHVDEPPLAPTLIAPDAPEVEAMRSAVSVLEPPAPRPPIAPDLVGLPVRLRTWFLALDKEERHIVRQICRVRQSEPCAGLIAIKRDTDEAQEPHPIEALLAALPDEKSDGVDEFCRRTHRGRTCMTPLVVAFDGQPIEFVTSQRRFAFTPGDPVVTDWPTATTPWIALDRDGDGAITSGAELFGDSTGDANNGFEALAVLDDNHDGVVDRDDAAFAALVLWADTNADRKSSPDELSPLSGVVVSIPLAYHLDARCVRGNCEGERGTLHWRDAGGMRTGAVVDVYLRTR